MTEQWTGKWPYIANAGFRIVQNRAAEPIAAELGILPGAGAQIKNQKEPELSLKFRTEAGVLAI